MAVSRYQKKISGPLLDRIDIHARVQAACERQLERFDGTKLTCNAEIGLIA